MSVGSDGCGGGADPAAGEPAEAIGRQPGPAAPLGFVDAGVTDTGA